MMKTLQTLTTFLLLFISIKATAQEKQNDATLEETIEWLNRYGFEMNLFTMYTVRAGIEDYDKLVLKVGEFVYDWVLDGNDCGMGSSNMERWIHGENILEDMTKIEYRCINLKNITSFKIEKDYYGFFIFITTNEISVRMFYKSNKEMVDRVIKAFKHLFKLLDIDHKVEFIDKREFVDENKF